MAPSEKRADMIQSASAATSVVVAPMAGSVIVATRTPLNAAARRRRCVLGTVPSHSGISGLLTTVRTLRQPGNRRNVPQRGVRTKFFRHDHFRRSCGPAGDDIP